MNKCDDWHSGASNIPDSYGNLVSTNQKSRIPITPPSDFRTLATIPFTGNGFIMDELASTDLHLVADDLSAGSNWNSRVGGWVANHTGSPTVGVETPLYPSGGWAGSGNRTSVADFTTSKYYKISYNIAHALTATSTTTYEALIQTGVLANEESYFARYITASTKYNLRLYSKNDGSNNYRLYVEVDHATTNAICIKQVSQMAILLVTFKYDGASKTLTMYLNGKPVTTASGNVGSSTGSGNIINDTSTNFFIGLTDTAVGLPLVKGKLIEIVRHTTELDDATILQRFQKMAGVLTAGNAYPSVATTRNSFGFIPVNKKIWAFTYDWPMMNENGIMSNVSYGCTMYSTAITDGTGGSTNLAITGGVTIASEANAINSAVNGQTLTIPYNGSLEKATWKNLNLSQNQKSAATVVWRPIGGSTAYLYIFDEITTNYWSSGTTWGAAPTAIDLSSFIISGTGTLTDPYYSNVPFTTAAWGAGIHNIDFIVHNNSLNDGTKSIKVYWCQACDSGQFAPEPLAAIHFNGGDLTVFLGTIFQYASTLVNWNTGQVNFDFRPIFSSTQPRLSPSNAQTLLSGSTGTNFLRLSINSAVFTYADAASHSMSLSTTYNSYDLLQFQLRWNDGNNKMVGQITNKSVTGTAFFTRPQSSGDFKFGTSSQSPGGFFKNVVIKGP